MTATYDLLPAQREFIHCEADTTLDIAIYQGGFGSGKTWSGALLGLLLCQKYPGILGLVLAKTYPMVRDTTMRTYFEHIDALGLERKRHYTFNEAKSSLIFHCWGDSTILFRHLQDPEKIKSINAGFIELEEASQLSEADFRMVLSRVRQVGIPRRRVFGHTNPPPTKGWIYKYFVQNNQGKQVIEDENGRAVVHYRRIIAPTTENRFLSPEYVANMKQQYDEEYYRINVLGQDGDYTSGLVVKHFTSENIQPVEFDPQHRLHISCDFNVDPCMWVVAQRFPPKYHFVDEIVKENTTVVEMVDEFVRRYPPERVQGGITINGDSSGNNRNVNTERKNETSYTIMRNRLSELGYRDIRIAVRTKNPAIQDRVEAFNAKICNANGHANIYIHPRCKHLITNLENLHWVEGTSDIWEPTVKEIEKDKSLKFTKHIYDAASYMVEYYDPIKHEGPDEGPGVWAPDLQFGV